MTPDMINGCFELLGAVLVGNHCRSVMKDKSVKGVSIISTFIFTIWGVWNLRFYSGLDQWYSFYGSILITSVNAFWVGLMVYYREKT